MSPIRLGTALLPRDGSGRQPRYGILGINDDGDTLTVIYEGHQDGVSTLLLPPHHRRQPTAELPRDLFTVRLTRYSGQEDATPDRVALYLMTNYTANGQAITPRYARELVTGNPDVAAAMEMASFAYYPGDKTADRLAFDYIPDSDTDGDGEPS